MYFHDDRNKRCWRDDDGVESVQSDEEEDTRDYYPKHVMANLEEHGKLEFKMREHTYRMVPVTGTGDYMYRKGTLRKARMVSVLNAGLPVVKFCVLGLV